MGKRKRISLIRGYSRSRADIDFKTRRHLCTSFHIVIVGNVVGEVEMRFLKSKHLKADSLAILCIFGGKHFIFKKSQFRPIY